MNCTMCNGVGKVNIKFFNENWYTNLYCELDTHKKYIPCGFCHGSGRITLWYCVSYYLYYSNYYNVKFFIYDLLINIKEFFNWRV